MTGIKGLIAAGISTTAAGSMVAFFQNFDVGGLVSAGSVAVITLATAGATAYGIIVQARIKANKELEEASKGSLTAQLDRMEANQAALAKRLEDANHKLHEERNQWAADRLRHANEVERLTEQIELLHETIGRQSVEIKRQAEQVNGQAGEIHRLTARIAELTRGVERVEQATSPGSGDVIPTPAGGPTP